MFSPAQIKRLLLDDVRDLASHPELVAKNPGRDFTRPKKLPLEDILRFPIFMKQDSTGSELLAYFGNDVDTAPTLSAYIQQREKLLPDTFRKLLHKFNAHFDPALYKGDLVLTAVDGTGMSMSYNPGCPLTFIKPNKASPDGHNELHLTAALRVADGMYSDSVIQPAPQLDERAAFCDMIDRDTLSKGTPLYLADRGFPSYNVFAHCFKKGAFFLIRAKDLYVERLLKHDMPDPGNGEFDVEVDRIIVRHQSKKLYSRPDIREAYRFVDKNTPFDFIEYKSRDEFHMHLRVVRVKVDDNLYEYLITNLPAEKYSPAQLRILYWIRWKVETSILHLKKVVGAEAFHCRSLVNVSHELLARLVKYNFCSAVASIARNNVEHKKGKKHPHQINFSLAIKKTHEFLCQKGSEKPINIIRIIEKYTLPVRDERKFPRNKHFQKPLTFLYRH